MLKPKIEKELKELLDNKGTDIDIQEFIEKYEKDIYVPDIFTYIAAYHAPKPCNKCIYVEKLGHELEPCVKCSKNPFFTDKFRSWAGIIVSKK